MTYTYDKIVNKIPYNTPYNHFLGNIAQADWSLIQPSGAGGALYEKHRTYFNNAHSRIKDTITIRDWVNRLLFICPKISQHESLIMNRNLELLYVVCNGKFLESCYEQIASTGVGLNISLSCDYEPVFSGVDHMVLEVDEKYYYVKIKGADVISFNEVTLDKKLVENYTRFLTSRTSDIFAWSGLRF
jgi:hypothetical protein